MPVDVRFFAPLGALSLGELANQTGSDLHGDGDLEAGGETSDFWTGRGNLPLMSVRISPPSS